MSTSAVAVPTVVYVTTHYPRVALTFILLEIRELERIGMRVTPVAINTTDESELISQALSDEHQRTTYLKALGPIRLGRATARVLLRHPVRMMALLRVAVSSSRLDLPVLARRLVHLAYAAAMVEAVGTAEARHFHAHFGQAPATVAWFAAEIAGFSTGVPRTWSFTIHGFHDFADEKVSRLDLKARSARFVCCVSDFTRAQLCRVTEPDLWDRYHVVRCGIDLDAFPYRPPSQAAGRVRVVMVARLSPEKGHLVLLSALRELRDRQVDVELEVIGGGPSAALIQSTADDLGLADRVTLSGELGSEVVSDHLADADIFCLPSFAEGIPVAIMEAMAIGLPVVTTYVGGVPELAINGETALVVPASNARELAGAIEQLATQPELRERLARNGRQRVCELHDSRRNAQQLHQLFAADDAHE